MTDNTMKYLQYAGDFSKHFKLNVEEAPQGDQSEDRGLGCLGSGSGGLQKRDGWSDNKEAGPRGPCRNDATEQRGERRLRGWRSQLGPCCDSLIHRPDRDKCRIKDSNPKNTVKVPLLSPYVQKSFGEEQNMKQRQNS